MATFPPRMSRILLSGRARRSTPSRIIWPESGANVLLFILRIARAVWVFPDPLSPTRPTISLRSTVRSTSRISRMGSRRSVLTYPMLRPLMRSSGGSAAGVAAALTSFFARSDGGTLSSPRAYGIRPYLVLHGLTQPVADQIEAQHRTDDHHSGKHGYPPLAGVDVLRALGDEDTPFRRRRVDAESQETEPRRIQYRPAQAQCGLDDGRPQAVGQQVIGQNPQRTVADAFRRARILGFTSCDHLAAHNADKVRGVSDRHGRHDVGHGVPQHRRQAYRQDERRKRLQNVDQAHHEKVKRAAQEPAERAEQGAHDKGERRHEEGDQEIELGRGDDPRKNVAAERIGAHQMG